MAGAGTSPITVRATPCARSCEPAQLGGRGGRVRGELAGECGGNCCWGSCWRAAWRCSCRTAGGRPWRWATRRRGGAGGGGRAARAVVAGGLVHHLAGQPAAGPAPARRGPGPERGDGVPVRRPARAAAAADVPEALRRRGRRPSSWRPFGYPPPRRVWRRRRSRWRCIWCLG